MDVVRLLGSVLAESPHNRQSMVQISGAQHCCLSAVEATVQHSLNICFYMSCRWRKAC